MDTSESGSRPPGSTLTVPTVVFASLTVGLLLTAGTWLLISGLPNFLIRAGLAVYCYAAGFNRAYMTVRHAVSTSLRFGLRTTWVGYVIAGGLAGVGSATYGGPIGVFGTCAALVWITLWLWMLKRSARWTETTDHASSR
jgi:hypothetical protein